MASIVKMARGNHIDHVPVASQIKTIKYSQLVSSNEPATMTTKCNFHERDVSSSGCESDPSIVYTQQKPTTAFRSSRSSCCNGRESDFRFFVSYPSFFRGSGLLVQIYPVSLPHNSSASIAKVEFPAYFLAQYRGCDLSRFIEDSIRELKRKSIRMQWA